MTFCRDEAFPIRNRHVRDDDEEEEEEEEEKEIDPTT